MSACSITRITFLTGLPRIRASGHPRTSLHLKCDSPRRRPTTAWSEPEVRVSVWFCRILSLGVVRRSLIADVRCQHHTFMNELILKWSRGELEFCGPDH